MDIAASRIANHRINNQLSSDPVETVTWMGALQAQDYGQALWAVGLRTQNATRDTIEAAIASGKIIRTWPMRGTIHFVPAEDAAWMLSLSAPRLVATDRLRMTHLELTDAIIDHSAHLLHDAFRNNSLIARPAIMQLLEEAGISTKGQRGYHILWRLALAGLICIGPMEGKQQTFAWLADWAPQGQQLERDEALAELARRYIRSHGPATIQDFATWSGQNLTDSRHAFASIQSEVRTEIVNGREYLTHRDAQPAARNDETYLLPGFDEYLLGYKDRSDILHTDHATKVVPGGNGIFLPMIVSGGQIVGTWKRTMKPKSIHIQIQPFTELSRAVHQQIDTELQRYSKFMGLPLS